MSKSNKISVEGSGNINIQDVKDSHVTVNIHDPQKPSLPKELTLRIPRTHPDDIIGREADLEQLHDLLSKEERVVVVNGLGGIGKTTLAQVYIQKYYNNYHHIAWITQHSESIANDFVNTEGLLTSLGIEAAGLDHDQLFKMIIWKLKAIEGQPGLLIIDNGEQSVKTHLDLLPQPPSWHLLVTSREEIAGFHCHPLGFLSEKQSIALFKKHYPYDHYKEQDIQALVKAVDHHTLTIELLAKTAAVHRYSITDLHQAVEKDLEADVDIAHNRHEGNVENIGTYLRAAFKLSRLEANELWLMKQFVCLPPEFHSYNLLRELIIEEDGAYAAIFAKTLDGLSRKGWLLHNMAADSYKMHRIIAAVVRKEQVIAPADIATLIARVTEKLRIYEEKDSSADKFAWLPYGDALLTGCVDDTSSKISILQHRLALVHQDIGDYVNARALLDKVILFNEKQYGVDHPATADSYSSLASVIQDLGDYYTAHSLLEKTLRINEQHLGADHPTTSESYTNLASVLYYLGDYNSAKDFMERSLHLDEKYFESDHPSLAISRSNLAMMLQNLGDFEGARPLLEKAVASLEKKFGTDHPKTAIGYSNLSLVLRDLRDHAGARAYLEKATLIDEKHFGPDHPDTMIDYCNLAIVLQDLRDHAGAQSLLEKAVRSGEKNFGTEHPSTAKLYCNLAGVYSEQGYYEQALVLVQKALGIFKKTLPAGHPEIDWADNLCQALLSQLSTI